MTGVPYANATPKVRQHRGTMRATVIIFVSVLVIAGIFQLFGRYTYLKSGERIIRIDRFTQRACVVYPISMGDGSSLDALAQGRDTEQC